MIKVECLKDYVKICSKDNFLKLASDIYQITDFICEDYPKHREWYFNKQLPGIFGKERNILFVRNPENKDEIISMACLKKDEEEQKICTLYVSDKCRGLGVGSSIIEKSMEWLETTKPLITLADYKLDMFAPIIKKYDWQLTEIVTGLYNNRSKELCFNGKLTKEELSEKELHQRLVKTLVLRKKKLEEK